MNRIDRLFGILILLQSRKYITAENIAEKFGISVRTVYRDIKALGEQGVPVGFEPARGYFIVQGYFLPPVAFNTEEANALLLVESIAKSFSDKSIQQHYTSALNKIKAVLRNSQKEKLELLNQNIRLQVPSCFNSDTEHLSRLQEAIASHSILEFTYTNAKEEPSTRRVEPIGLVFYALSWHVIAWCHLRSDYRDFKISRILQIRSTNEPFGKEDHIDLNTYMKQLPVEY